jgi:hypothetical protein
MRFSGRGYLVAIGILIVATIWYATAKRSTRDRAQVRAFVSVEQIGEAYVVISAVATNIGRTTLYYDHSPFNRLGYRVGGVWTNTPLARNNYVGTGLLGPGESVRDGFSLPGRTTACQVGCAFQNAGARGVAALSFSKPGHLNRLAGWVLPLLPGGSKRVFETWSVEVATGVKN